MSGHIIVPCRPDHARHVEFFQSLMALDLPPDTTTQLYPGFFAHENRTRGVKEALYNGDKWVCIIEDDQLLEPNAVKKLLHHNADIVSVNLLAREEPFAPYIFEKVPEFGYVPMPLESTATRQVDAIGLGGVLIRSKVFETIPEPWFTVNEEFKTDDLYFSDKATKAGFRLYHDPTIPSGHISKLSVWPRWDGQRWVTDLKLHGGTVLTVPAASRVQQFEDWRNANTV